MGGTTEYWIGDYKFSGQQILDASESREIASALARETHFHSLRHLTARVVSTPANVSLRPTIEAALKESSVAARP